MKDVSTVAPWARYPVELEVAGHMAMFARPDTGATPTSYVAPTWSAAKGIYEAIARFGDGAAWKLREVHVVAGALPFTLARGCGLKPVLRPEDAREPAFTLARGCGLKRERVTHASITLARGCGLKLLVEGIPIRFLRVHPRTRVWIETVV